jgi:hypothetical protein
LNYLGGGFGREPDADSTVEVLNLPNSDILEGGPNVLHEALLEVVPIVSLKGKLVVMGDDTTHQNAEKSES